MSDGEFNNYGDPLARGSGTWTTNNWGDGVFCIIQCLIDSTDSPGWKHDGYKFNYLTQQNMSLYAKKQIAPHIHDILVQSYHTKDQNLEHHG